MDNQAIKKLEADLWESADLLRQGSNLTSQQYCMPVLGLLFLLLTGQMAAGIAAHRDGRSRRVRCTLLTLFLLSAGIFWLCLSVIAWEVNFPGWSREPPAWLAAACDCPGWTVWTFEAAAAGILILLFSLSACNSPIFSASRKT